ncbi:ribosome-binding factor A [Kordiimonas sediminis]|uniref:Ribosome-binding factor A n=1 Tax=Kordiimonas sediminis TaxID=1735581 RepID=A0A919E672_9PROT|nr:30S ribosome-binding factor RbfA [Kordiimonas sediminis]GHF16349.1 ribosome-binding factor A [Kordiimonas sediminis]
MSKSDHESSGGPSLRLLRVGENIRHAISTVLSRGMVHDEALEGVSVTVSEVRVSPDLRNATVFIMPLGGDPKLVVTKALNTNSAFIRGQMSKMVHMKYMPKLRFKLDDSFDEATHIDQILRDPKVVRDTKVVPADSDDSTE